MRRCKKCGAELRRMHRTFAERFAYMAIYECRECHDVSFTPRRYRYHLGETCRCPMCGTFRVTRLKERDKIDRMYTGFLNMLERRSSGGKLFHCRYCRVQFYDRRSTVAEREAQEAAREQDVAADV
ncbi:MAG: hypothetical protein ABSC23_20510 [Bryobacteraceae bacterium]